MMHERDVGEQVVTVHNLTDYFRRSIDEVIAKQSVDVDPHAAHYVVNLLTLFSRSEELYEEHSECYGLRPLASMLADAATAPTREERNFSLQRIGDVALFISGYFADSLAHKIVDLDYYIYMGENAYGSLSEEIRGTLRGNAFADIYKELAIKFQLLVDVLNEISEARTSDRNLVRAYELWRRTGSKRAEQLLRQEGVVPIGVRRH